MKTDTTKDPVELFLSEAHCLLIQPSACFLSSMTTSLVVLGAKKENIHFALRFEDAETLVNQFRPLVLITEHQIGDKFGLDLIDRMDNLVGEPNRVAIMATRNSSESAVAEAAEEQIDAYILKPFSMGEFQTKVYDTIKRKSRPTDYLNLIRRGRGYLINKEYKQAFEQFSNAKSKSSKPSLAHYYCGVLQEHFLLPESAESDLLE